MVGLSLGGALAVWLAAHHPEIGGLVAINAAVEPGGADLVSAGRELLAAGTDVLPGIGSDIARPDVAEQAYAVLAREGEHLRAGSLSNNMAGVHYQLGEYEQAMFPRAAEAAGAEDIFDLMLGDNTPRSWIAMMNGGEQAS